MGFKHFLITRFNTTLISEPVELDRQGGAKRYDPAWLEERVRLFEKICVPTIKAQTCKDFEWLVLFGEQTPPDFIAYLRNKHSFTAVVGSQWKLYSSVELAIATRLLKDGLNYIITTNIDSDDGISKDFIAEIQAQFNEQEMAIYVDNGVRWDIRNDTYLSTSAPRNPFPSIIEPVTDSAFRTVLAYSHGQLNGYYGKVVHINNKTTRWLMGIHGGNLVNRINKVSEDKPKPFADIAATFGL